MILPQIDDERLAALLNRHRAWLDSAGAQGERAQLGGMSLARRAFWSAELTGADLHEADLKGANLDHARLAGAGLQFADLAGASLWSANLQDADLTGANLRGAKLDHADLGGADLRGCDLTNTSVWGARLAGADLRGAVGLQQKQLETASLDETTRLPGVFAQRQAYAKG